MPIKSRRYRKRNKLSRTRKNKITRRYKKQMKGGNSRITSEKELKESWENKKDVQNWLVNDGVGTMTTIYREDAATGEIMPYEKFKEKIDYYLNQVINGQADAFIQENRN